MADHSHVCLRMAVFCEADLAQISNFCLLWPAKHKLDPGGMSHAMTVEGFQGSCCLASLITLPMNEFCKRAHCSVQCNAGQFCNLEIHSSDIFSSRARACNLTHRVNRGNLLRDAIFG